MRYAPFLLHGCSRARLVVVVVLQGHPVEGIFAFFVLAEAREKVVQAAPRGAHAAAHRSPWRRGAIAETSRGAPRSLLPAASVFLRPPRRQRPPARAHDAGLCARCRAGEFFFQMPRARTRGRSRSWQGKAFGPTFSRASVALETVSFRWPRWRLRCCTFLRHYYLVGRDARHSRHPQENNGASTRGF